MGHLVSNIESKDRGRGYDNAYGKSAHALGSLQLAERVLIVELVDARYPRIHSLLLGPFLQHGVRWRLVFLVRIVLRLRVTCVVAGRELAGRARVVVSDLPLGHDDLSRVSSIDLLLLQCKCLARAEVSFPVGSDLVQ